ncbi:hypothetical protein [Lysobacter gummosus]|uniref:hypothetical protein n=1 Tax=Lysobacter gummosus TaxID=262324 RepID=UPI0036434579
MRKRVGQLRRRLGRRFGGGGDAGGDQQQRCEDQGQPVHGDFLVGVETGAGDHRLRVRRPRRATCVARSRSLGPVACGKRLLWQRSMAMAKDTAAARSRVDCQPRHRPKAGRCHGCAERFTRPSAPGRFGRGGTRPRDRPSWPRRTGRDFSSDIVSIRPPPVRRQGRSGVYAPELSGGPRSPFMPPGDDRCAFFR